MKELETVAMSSIEYDEFVRHSNEFVENTPKAKTITRNKKGDIQYDGALGEPLDKEKYVVETFLFGLFKSYNEEAIQEVFDSRIVELYEYFGLNHGATGAAEKLVLKLVHEHIPGFKYKKVSKKVGRPSEWDFEEVFRLFYDLRNYSERNPNCFEVRAHWTN